MSGFNSPYLNDLSKSLNFGPLTQMGAGGGVEYGNMFSSPYLNDSSMALNFAPVDAMGGIGMPNIGVGGGGGGIGLMQGAQLGIAGLGTIGNLWAAFQAQKLAKKQFKYTKGVTETNLANQIKSYNTSLADRSRSRAVVEGQDPATAQAYIDENSLKRFGT